LASVYHPAYLPPLKPPPPKPKLKNHTTGELHPRNLHRAPYDFPRLTAALPELARFVQPHPLAGDTIDFSNPAAVLTLNRALLKLHYGIAHWDLPPGFLCPPVPSRVDYLHHLADLLAADTPGNALPRGPALRALDIGTGANAIYPLLAASLFGWSVTGTDIDPASINWARQLAAANPPLATLLDFRLQPSASALFANITAPTDSFAVSLCNPPFHASPEEAAAGTLRKIRNLGSPAARSSAKLALNFGGRANELWCPGGEVAFIRRMIAESIARPTLCVWFTTLVSKRASLPIFERDLHRARAVDLRVIPMFAGQKQSRLLAWSFLPAADRRARLAAIVSIPA
jgi:23S rRNA (adenine1618-N6)-methyltransferase